MLRTHHHFFRSLFQLLDAITVAASWFLAFWIRFDLMPQWLPHPEKGVTFFAYAPTALVLVFIWFLSLQTMGAYKSWRASKLGVEILNILKASALGFAIFVSIQHFVARTEISRATVLLFFALVTVGLLISRISLRTTLHQLRRRGFNQRHIIYAGHPRLAQLIEHRLNLRPELGFVSSGIVLVGSEVDAVPDQSKEQLPVLGQLRDLGRILSENSADHLLVCLRSYDSKYLDDVMKVASEHNVSVRIIPDILNYAVLGFEVEEFEGLPVISLNQSRIVGWNAVLKRISDIIYASLSLIVFSPFMILIALIIKLTSKGPVLYSQERMGLDGANFKMWKFRSMRTDAEVQSGAVWAKENDPRVTWIGKILRKTSLDELPQLFNVLKGEMSCVGPRPERPVFVEKFKSQVPGYMLRHKVKAGMTGWAQINGFRGNTSLEGRIEYDLYYIANWSLLLDLKIMFLTLFKGFIAPNAY